MSEAVTVINKSTNPVFISEVPHNLLDASIDQDTTAHSVAQGDLILGNSTPKWDGLAIGTSGDYLRSNGTTAAWSTLNASDLSGAVAQSNLFAGTMVLINSTESQTSHTISNADTDVTTYSLAANTYTSIMTEVEGYITFANNSTKQAVSLKIKYTAAQAGVTMLAEYSGAAVSAACNIPFFFKGTAAASNLTIHVTQSAAGADATATVFVNAVRVYGIV